MRLGAGWIFQGFPGVAVVRGGGVPDGCVGRIAGGGKVRERERERKRKRWKGERGEQHDAREKL